MIRRIWYIFLALGLFCALLPELRLTSCAATYSGTCGDNLTWSFNSDSGTLTITGNGAMFDWGLANAPWYKHSASITSLNLSAEMTEIGNYAFYDCVNVSSVTIPNDVVRIGSSAFRNTGLREVHIGDNVIIIEDLAFYGCSSLTKIYVDEDNNHFSSDDYGVLFDKSGTHLMICPGGFSGSYVIPDSVVNIDDNSFYKCSKLTNIIIGPNVSSIGDSAFFGCTALQDVNIPDNVTIIGALAFYSCKGLTEVTIGNGVTQIGQMAFSWCTELQTITIGNGIRKLYSDSFSNTAFYNRPENWENGVLILGNCILNANENLNGTIIIEENIQCIAEKAFSSSSDLNSIIVDSNNLFFSSDAYGVLYDRDKNTLICCPCGFSGAYSVPDTVETIGDFALTNCHELQYITFGSVVRIGRNACANCSCLSGIAFSNSIESIESFAFYNCASLTNVVIPNSVCWLGNSILKGCNALSELTIPFVGESRSTNTFLGHLFGAQSVNGVNSYGELVPDSLQTVILSEGCIEIPENAFFNCDSINNIIISETVERIGCSAFFNCKELTSISIPSNVTCIRENSFFGCSSLMSVSIPNTVLTIDDSSFFGCSGLTSISIPEQLEIIGEYAFAGCSSITSFSIPSTVSSIGKAAFKDCSSLTSIRIPFVGESQNNNTFLGFIFGASNYSENHTYIPNNLRTVEITSESSIVDDNAFYECYFLTNISLHEGVTQIGDSAFYLCYGLSHIQIPNTVTQINDSAFFGCGGLNEVTLNEGLSSIGNNAFAYCSGLSSIIIPESVTTVGNAAFLGCNNLTAYTSLLDPSCWQRSGCFEVVFLGTVNDTISWQLEMTQKRLSILGNGSVMLGLTEENAPWRPLLTLIESVNLGSEITDISPLVFSACVNLESFSIPDGSNYYSVRDNALYDYSGTELICFPVGRTGEYSIPEGTVKICESSFYRCTKLVKVNIPESVISICNSAFEGCSSLQSTTILSKNCVFGNSPYLLGIPESTIVTGFVDSTALTYSLNYGYQFEDIETVEGVDVLICPSCNGSGTTGTHWVTCTKCNGTGKITKRWCNTCGSTYIVLMVVNGRPPYYYCNDCLSTNIGESTETCSACHGQGGSNQQTQCTTCYGDGIIQHTHSLEMSTQRPSCTMYGYTSYTCTNSNCRKHYTTDYELPLGHIFVNGVCTRCGAHGQQNYIFEDINETDFFYYPVMWAVSHNPIITAGIDATHFGPNNDCTREQIVTFLWAANGKPEPATTGEAFSDVPKDAWYYKPVMWAVQHEITSGVSGGVFGVGQPCTRAQAMTFLWAAKGKPEPESTVSPFTDVSSGDWFCKPILWAAENGVTAGIGDGLFGVNNTCTRAQIITFLYKVYGAG